MEWTLTIASVSRVPPLVLAIGSQLITADFGMRIQRLGRALRATRDRGDMGRGQNAEFFVSEKKRACHHPSKSRVVENAKQRRLQHRFLEEHDVARRGKFGQVPLPAGSACL
jgi:hypothetical protein